ncbi:MAG: tRNA (N6-threonylcarbamoyladenosine(37)-N6)-methyltransferase TrmO [Candidatus Electronema sp. VV]
MQQAEVHFIGVVHCNILRPEDAPAFYDESERVGVLEIFPEYQDGLAGIAAGQTVTVLFWLHLADRSTLKVYPRGDKTKGLRGVFATRSPMRPNPIAVSELKVLAVDGCRLEVSGLDIINGTPILDLKKRMKG